ncbi:MAG: NAD(+)/NADH kinase [Candidatus Omnitrophica bacterium]|nr:NAD(+)/NADH kinase [Candidatus Omnitrophota bacterium]
MKKPINVLILAKRTTYEIYLEHLKSWKLSARDLQRFKKTNENHQRTLREIEKNLQKYDVKYQKVYRGQHFKMASHDFVITVGGDGTFLEAARDVVHQLVLGVNSDPQRSVGRFCFARGENFERILKQCLSGKARVQVVNRLELSLFSNSSKVSRKINVLNDILICHSNPAAMSRYGLVIGSKREEQKSSGLWVSTAAGSTGAIHSAGGKTLPLTSAHFQYQPRELYPGSGHRCQLTGGVLVPSQKIKVVSLMRDGKVFVDGAHLSFPFPIGEEILLKKSSQPLQIII